MHKTGLRPRISVVKNQDWLLAKFVGSRKCPACYAPVGPRRSKQEMKLEFSTKYFFVFAIILSIEVLIAIFVMDQFVRPFVGDLLVVLLLFTLAKAFFATRNDQMLALCILLFAYLVEIGQYFDLVSRLGLVNSEITSIVLGTSFDWRDFLAYTIGFILILIGIRRKRMVF